MKCNTPLCYTSIITKIVPNANAIYCLYLRVLPPPREEEPPPERDPPPDGKLLVEREVLGEEGRTDVLDEREVVLDERTAEEEERDGAVELTLVRDGCVREVPTALLREVPTAFVRTEVLREGVATR